MYEAKHIFFVILGELFKLRITMGGEFELELFKTKDVERKNLIIIEMAVRITCTICVTL